MKLLIKKVINRLGNPVVILSIASQIMTILTLLKISIDVDLASHIYEYIGTVNYLSIKNTNKYKII